MSDLNPEERTWRVDDHPRREYPRVVDSRGRYVADCASEDVARLVAAAPLMHDFCDFVEKHAFERKWDGDTRAFSMLAAIRAANPKAGHPMKEPT